MRQKKIFSSIFVFLSFLLILLPFLVTFNEVLTKFVERIGVYSWIQKAIVPYEVQMVKLLTSPFNLSFVPYANGMMIKGVFLEMTWNCLGWQSLLLLTITLITGLSSGHYTRWSKVETVLIGLLGTFLVNLFRLAFIVILFSVSRPLYAVVYHDYLAAIVTIFWLFFFWWFSYSFVLEEKESRIIG